MATKSKEERPAGDGEGAVRFAAHHLVDRCPDPGWYPLAIVGAYQRATDTGSVAIKVKFEVTQDGDFEGVEVWDQFVVEGASDEGADVALRRLARLYRACGFEVEADRDYEVSALAGREVLGRIVEDSFQGQPRSRVRAFRPLAAAAKTKAAAAEGGKTPF
jgi:hypothetical protein